MKYNTQHIANQLGIKPWQADNTIALLEGGATIPFISRYRKEATGMLDEVAVQEIKALYEKHLEVEKRKTAIMNSIEEQGKMTDELKKQLREATSLSTLEDLYLPYKPKRRTRASEAREKGLEPLAAHLLRQTDETPERTAQRFLNDRLVTVEEALQGACDIIAEWINENSTVRQVMRQLFEKEATISSKLIKGKESEALKYKDYFAFSEPLARCAPHRIMALLRGRNEGFLRIDVAPDTEKALRGIEKKLVKGYNRSAQLVKKTIEDAYKRLLQPSLETEILNQAKERADKEAIRLFTANLRQVLLSPPLGGKRVMAVDPGFRTGCKLVCLNDQGGLLTYTTIFPHPPVSKAREAAETVVQLLESHKIEALAVGNGTAGRETEDFLLSLPQVKDKIPVYAVNESGASIYSTSKLARDEMPDLDATVRGAVSIGRRLIDPLAELVKIEPKSIGVGQYQHDVDQQMLQNALKQTVESCVNLVGVDVNRASPSLLSYVSGIGSALGQNIVAWRNANGPFRSRKELKKVPRLGDKAFEQAAGFLRIPESDNPLDNSAVHPESYPVVEQIARDQGVSIHELIENPAHRKQIDLRRYVTAETGLPTLTDIINELEKPGRDPRKSSDRLAFKSDIRSLDDLKPGMEVEGIVTNITNFGAFVDIGVKQDGLVHISEIADRFIKSPEDVLKINQRIKAKVLEVDCERKRISLSMRLNHS